MVTSGQVWGGSSCPAEPWRPACSLPRERLQRLQQGARAAPQVRSLQQAECARGDAGVRASTGHATGETSGADAAERCPHSTRPHTATSTETQESRPEALLPELTVTGDSNFAGHVPAAGLSSGAYPLALPTKGAGLGTQLGVRQKSLYT